MNKIQAPICLFTYNRLTETRQTVNALQQNFLASESNLIVFSDGGKDEASWVKVNTVRAYLKTIIGFKSIEIFESPVNKGLANSIISGVAKIFEQHEKVIVLEDDLITSRNFLDFMNQALDFYENESKVLSISGYSFSDIIPNKYKYDAVFGIRASSWGWATWNNRWKAIDWQVNDYVTFKNNFLLRLKFNLGGSDLSRMLDNQMSGKLNSWAIRFCYHQFTSNMVDVYPKVSKVMNNGFSSEATHSKYFQNRFKTKIDDSNNTYFCFPTKIKINSIFAFNFYFKYSILLRLFNRILNLTNIK